MTLPSCFSLLNADYFSNIQTNIGACKTGAELQALVNDVFASISLLESTITSQIAFLGPIEALLTPPTSSLGSIVTWITSFITDYLTPMLKPYAIYASQLTALAAEVTTLTAAITAAAANLGVSITIPPITIGCTL